MAGVKGLYRNIRKSLGVAAILLIFDVVYFGSPLLAPALCLIWIIASFVKSVISRSGWMLALVRIIIPVMTFWLVRINNEFQLTVATENAQRIVVACERYHADNGSFPKNLDELVPRYIHAVPPAKYCIGPGGRFYYYYHSGKPMLVWQIAAPYYRRIYNFDSRRWSYLD